MIRNTGSAEISTCTECTQNIEGNHRNWGALEPTPLGWWRMWVTLKNKPPPLAICMLIATSNLVVLRQGCMHK